MQQERPENRVWRTLGPAVIYYILSIVMEILALMVLAGVINPDIMQSIQKYGTTADGYEKIYSLLMQYALPITMATTLAIFPFMYRMFHKDRKREHELGIEQNKKAPLWKYAGIVILGAVLAVGLNNLIILSNISGSDQTYQTVSDSIQNTGIVLRLAASGLILPIGEELVYRGLIYKRFRERNSMWKAAAFSSLVFGMMHGNTVQFIYAFIIGMALCYVYEKYGSVKAPVVLHIAANLTSALMSEYGGFSWIFHDVMRVGIVTVVCSTVAAALYVWMQKIDNGHNGYDDIRQKIQENQNPAV